MVEGLTIMLGVFINLLYTHTMPNNHYCSTYMMPYPHLLAKHCLRVGRKSRFFPDLRHEIRQHVAVKVWWVDLQSCWECSSTCYTPIQCQTTTIAAPHDAIPPLVGQTCLTVGRKSRSEAWTPPTWGSKSMVEGVTIMLGVFITLLYIHTMPNIYYCSTCMLLYPHLRAKLVWELAENRDFFLIWGMKSANMWL